MPGGVVAAFGACLVSPSPSWPAEHGGGFRVVVPDEAGEQPAQFGDGDRDQLAGGNSAPFFAAAARVTVRKAWANIASVNRSARARAPRAPDRRRCAPARLPPPGAPRRSASERTGFG